MGNCMNKKGPRPSIALAILGLDNAGKTVTTKGLVGESPEGVVPTMGFSSVDFSLEQYNITLFDLGGGKNIRGIWKNYFADIYGCIYVVDSSAKDRVDECHSTIQNLLQHPQVQGKPLLILANKQDVSGALDEVDICEQLNLEDLVNQSKTPCRVETCSAMLGYGKKLDKSIKQGMQWLVGMVTRDWETLHPRVEKDKQEKQEKIAREKKEKMERVRKIREERERKEKAERLARGEAEPQSDDEDEAAMIAAGGPFKRVDVKEIERKQQQAKEEKRKKKELESLRKSGHDTNSRGRDLYTEEGDSTPSQLSRKPLPSLHASEAHPTMQQSRTKLGQYDSPRPNRRFMKGTSQSMQTPPSGSDENDENGDTRKLRTTSSLTNSHWLRETTQTHSHQPRAADDLSPTKGGLSPLGHLGGEMGTQPARRGVLGPLTPLEPLDSLEQRSKKKKKKAKKNQTLPDGGLTEEGGVWPAPRASRSPRLDTVQEPDNESDPGQGSFSQKYNLIDELPELPSSRSQRLRPNYDDDLIT